VSPKKSSESLETIVSDPDAIPDDPETVDEITLPDGVDDIAYSPRASDYVDMSMLDHAPSVAQARESAHIPPHFAMKDLVDKTVYFVHKREQKAALPETGELRTGYFCLCAFADSKQEFTTWVGQTILFRELTLLQLPFKTTIVKRGRTYMFG
jgi:hypothetical protein